MSIKRKLGFSIIVLPLITGFLMFQSVRSDLGSFQNHDLRFQVEILCDDVTYFVPKGAWETGTSKYGDPIFRATSILDRESGERIRGRLEIWFDNPEADNFIQQRVGGLRFDVRARVPEFIRTIRITIDGIPHGHMMTIDKETDLTQVGNSVWDYSAKAQVFALEAQDRWLSIGSREFPIPPWEARFTAGESDVRMMLDVIVPRANERRWVNTNLFIFEWFDSLDQLANRHRYEAIEVKQNLRPFEQRIDIPAWVKDIRLQLMLSGRGWRQPQPFINGMYMKHTYAQMAGRLKEVARYFDPKKTAVYIHGWEGFYDCTTPRYAPDPEMGGEAEWQELVRTAHQLGYKLILHFDAWCVSFSQPEYWQVRDGSRRLVDPRLGHGPFERMSTTNYTSLDYKPWRDIFLERVERAVTRYGADGIHVDQAERAHRLRVSDTDGLDDARGLFLTMHAIRQRFPNVLLKFENVGEMNLGLSPLFEWGPGDQMPIPLLCKKIIYPYIRITGHLHTSGPHGEGGACFQRPVSQSVADERMRLMRLNDYIPTLHIADANINLTTPKTQEYFSWAREYDRRITSGELDYIY